MSIIDEFVTTTTDNPTVARLQIEHYRRMSGEQRLETGLRMWEFAREWIACSVRNERPQIGADELRRRVAQRMQSS
jgi:hypothetical protein